MDGVTHGPCEWLSPIAVARVFQLSESHQTLGCQWCVYHATYWHMLKCSICISVPLLQGVSPFRLTEYATLHPDFTELDAGEFALIAFTVGGYRIRDRNMASLNIQFAIRLTSYDSYDCIKGREPLPLYLSNETPLCVNDETLMVIPDETDAYTVQANTDIAIPAGPLYW